MCIRECVSAYVCVGTAHEACDVYFTDDHVGMVDLSVLSVFV